MKNIVFILCAIFVVTHARVVEKDAANPRVVNGEDVKIGERPFQVSLQDYSHFCGGSIVNEYWVVTAAHCVQGRSASSIKVVVGTVSLKEPYSSHQSDQIIVHKEYAPFDFNRNDIALVKVAVPFKFSSRVKPVALPEPYAKVKTNSSAVLSGWGGKVNTGSPTPDALQKATIFIADSEYCKAVMLERNKNIYPTNVCAYDSTIRRGQCNGDSGGPLTIDGKLTGVVSWSIKDPDCASTRYPGVYTRVTEYVNWILEHTK